MKLAALVLKVTDELGTMPSHEAIEIVGSVLKEACLPAVLWAKIVGSVIHGQKITAHDKVEGFLQTMGLVGRQLDSRDGQTACPIKMPLVRVESRQRSLLESRQRSLIPVSEQSTLGPSGSGLSERMKLNRNVALLSDTRLMASYGAPSDEQLLEHVDHHASGGHAAEILMPAHTQTQDMVNTTHKNQHATHELVNKILELQSQMHDDLIYKLDRALETQSHMQIHLAGLTKDVAVLRERP